MTDPKTLADMANEARSSQGAMCPGCGRRLFSYGRAIKGSRIIRYEACRTEGCERRFKTIQARREIVEEISPSGKDPLQDQSEVA